MNDTEDDENTEIIYINPKKDILVYSIPLTHENEGQTERAKEIAAKSLASTIVDMIEPTYIEMAGYELMQYRVIIKKYPDLP